MKINIIQKNPKNGQKVQLHSVEFNGNKGIPENTIISRQYKKL